MPASLATAMQIGSHAISPNLILAPMAGVTDKPFRVLCKKMGAGLCVSEMTISDPRFWRTSKSLHRMDHADETSPISVQIAGTDPKQLADAARFNVDHGAQIIDINMGCPAKKVCSKWAGSALMQDETLALQIVEAVVAACAPHFYATGTSRYASSALRERHAVHMPAPPPPQWPTPALRPASARNRPIYCKPSWPGNPC